MSLIFDPDSNASPNGTWDTTFLSDRDVSAQVPINFVPHPGVYVTAACFGNNIYNSDAAENCLSNLLSSQIRRYVIDLYWDPPNQRFGLCPVQIPNSSDTTQTSSILGGAAVVARTMAIHHLEPRQTISTFTANSSTTNTSSSTSAAVAGATYTVLSTGGDSRFLQLGPYQCSDTLTLASITSVFDDWLAATANTIDGKVIIWILNLHVAATLDNPTSHQIELSASQLPNASHAVSTYLQSLTRKLYNPGALLNDRQNLNSSWFRRGSADELPLNNYYNLILLPNGDIATEDGWPDENYIQIVKGKRLLVGFGDVDPSIAKYDTSADSNSIYPPGYLTSQQNINFQDNGELDKGCYYDPNEFHVKNNNNSWAIATINAINPPDLGDAADNLTMCGFSQLLNVTINGITADQQAGPYQQYGNNAIFSWAYGEPRNDTSEHTTETSKFRCAMMISADAYRGHWRTQYCNQNYRAACREGRSPYKWSISRYSVPYGAGDAACTGNASFDVPRTGLENTYLYNKVLNESRNDPSLLDGIWINFNSLDVQDCWVTTGVNGTCSYIEDSSATHSRQILIPTIAALIVLMLTVLTILVKCSANAKNSRIRRRGEGGWDYEGVPS